jgi:hypothetical protein
MRLHLHHNDYSIDVVAVAAASFLVLGFAAAIAALLAL